MTDNNNDRYDAGLAVRRAVLGDEYVDRPVDQADDFAKPIA